MHCDVVLFKEVSLQLFPKLEQCWGGPDGYRDVVPDHGCIDGKDLLSYFFLFTLISLQCDGVLAAGVPRTTRDVLQGKHGC